jgi:glucokinase
LRIGRYALDTGAVSNVERTPVDPLARNLADPVTARQARVLDQLSDRIAAYLRSPVGADAAAVGLAFAGPVTADESVTGAPTVWGPGGAPLPVGRILERRLGLPVLVTNDLTAAVWRYAEPGAEPFCLVTVSSGIGNKVFRDGSVLLDPAGYGGELGHWQVDRSPDAAACDCGGRGHLGAVASGRGVLAAARRAAREDAPAFGRSMLAVPADGVPDAIDNTSLVAAIRAGDGFATGLLLRALASLAMALTAVYCAIGVRRFIVIGGFALAVGERFVELLADALVEQGCFGLRPDEVRAMARLGAPDDDHSLVGVGRLLAARKRQPAVGPAEVSCAS